MNDQTTTAIAGVAMTEATRARALDLIDEQRRRIVQISDAVQDGQRLLQRSIVSLAWRSPARLEFDIRVNDLLEALARSSGALRASLVECDRARDLLRAGATVERRGDGWSKDFTGYPAAGRSR